VRQVIRMSGPLNAARWTDGYSDDNVSSNNPCDFLRREHEPARLEALRRMGITLAIGRDDPALPDNQLLSQILSEQGIPHALHLWDGLAHDWPWWQLMLRVYIDGQG